MHTRYNRIPRTPLAMFLSVGLLLLMAGTASAHSTAPTHAHLPAHAKVYKAIPAIGSTITQAPTTVTVFTLENINPNPKLSNLFVYAPTGELISQGNAQVSLQDPKQMSITIKPSGNGVYIVRWITVSALDGDPDQGAFFFNLQPKAPAKAPAQTKTTTAPPTASGTPLWVPILVGVLALLVGLGGGFGLGRRNAQTTVSSMRRAIAEQQEAMGTSPTPTPRPK
jgi:methionine-rich copper-binding protein CopC